VKIACNAQLWTSSQLSMLARLAYDSDLAWHAPARSCAFIGRSLRTTCQTDCRRGASVQACSILIPVVFITPLAGLVLPELEVEAFFLQQLEVRAALSQLALFQHVDHVHVDD
jgi:hypothetical protein